MPALIKLFTITKIRLGRTQCYELLSLGYAGFNKVIGQVTMPTQLLIPVI